MALIITVTRVVFVVASATTITTKNLIVVMVIVRTMVITTTIDIKRIRNKAIISLPCSSGLVHGLLGANFAMLLVICETMFSTPHS